MSKDWSKPNVTTVPNPGAKPKPQPTRPDPGRTENGKPIPPPQKPKGKQI